MLPKDPADPNSELVPTIVQSIQYKCVSCNKEYTLESNCRDCADGYRKGPINKTQCLVDKCFDPKSGRICNGLGICNGEAEFFIIPEDEDEDPIPY